MHELGILRHIVKTALFVAEKNGFEALKFISLDVGETSGFVPYYLRKLFPVAADSFPSLKKTDLIINIVPGNGLVIKEIGY